MYSLSLNDSTTGYAPSHPLVDKSRTCVLSAVHVSDIRQTAYGYNLTAILQTRYAAFAPRRRPDDCVEQLRGELLLRRYDRRNYT